VVVQEVNRAAALSAGGRFHQRFAGGKGGGGARLTPRGRLAVQVFRDLQDQLRRSAASLLPQLLPGAATASVHVAAAVSLEEVLGQLMTDYALRQPGVRVRAVFGASDELADQLRAGAPADLFLSADLQQIERLRAAQVLAPGAPRYLAENTLAAIGPADRAVPVRRAADLLGDAVTRVALADPGCPLGGYTRAYLEKLGLYAPLLPRVVRAENSRAVVAIVKAGQADVGLVYSSAATGCRILFRAHRLPVPIRYAGAVLGRGQQPASARQFLDFLTSQAALRRFKSCGFLPVRVGLSPDGPPG
jgi:molybdate transport system substrate-binding protein